MAIEIIKAGNPQAGNPKFQVECLKCNTIFSYNRSDIQSDRDGSYIPCPVCGNFISSIRGTRIDPPAPSAKDFYNK